nr:MAG TPA: hypothetical protein [Caudoviricetes sp.]
MPFLFYLKTSGYILYYYQKNIIFAGYIENDGRN